MGLTNWIYETSVLPWCAREGYSGYRSYWKEQVQREQLSVEENQSRQWCALKEMLTHAYDTSTFYRRRLQEIGVRPEDIRAPEDLAILPMLTRDDLRDYATEMCSRKYAQSEMAASATGGTTDTPVRFFRDLDCLPRKNAAQARFNAWAGMLPGDKTFYLWGARSDYAENPSWRWRIYDRYLMRRVFAQASLLNSDELEACRNSLNRFRPDVVYAYPTPLQIFCEYIRDSKLSVHQPRTVICTAESLLEHQKSVIRHVLGCQPFEHYGSREFGMIAAECELHEGLHFNPASAFVEFVPMQGEDGLHELVVTDLLNWGMPLIRYRSNDCALPARSVCSCGRGYLVMTKAIAGRTADTFVLPNGDLVPGVSLTNRVLQVCPGLRKTQVIQEKVDLFRLRYVPHKGFSQTDLTNLHVKLKSFLGCSVEWVFEAVPQIPREPSGKTRFCISRVQRRQNVSAVSESVR